MSSFSLPSFWFRSSENRPQDRVRCKNSIQKTPVRDSGGPDLRKTGRGPLNSETGLTLSEEEKRQEF